MSDAAEKTFGFVPENFTSDENITYKYFRSAENITYKYFLIRKIDILVLIKYFNLIKEISYQKTDIYSLRPTDPFTKANRID